MEKMNSVILVILVSAGAISLSMAAVDKIPAIWSLILPWLRPPYLHVVINVIIIAIAAASRSRRSQEAPQVRSQHLVSAKTPPPEYYAAYSSPPPEVRDVAEVPEAAAYERIDRVVELKPVMVNGFEVGADAEEEVENEGAVDGSTLAYNTPSPERFSPEFQSEYFPTADSVGNILARESNRKKKKSGEEVRHGGGWRSVRKSKSFKERSIDYDLLANRAEASLNRNRRVEASVDRSLTRNSLLQQNLIGNIPSRFKETTEEYETMESTWKKITEGASRASAVEEACAGPPLRKSSSFSEREIYNDSPSPSSSGIRKEESPSQDELNRRVEAFIRKVNDEIRLRRQNSSNQYIQLNSAA